MTSIFVKGDDLSKYAVDFLQTYIRNSTVYNLALFEKNADFCISLNVLPYPRESRFQCYYFNTKGGILEDLSSKIYYQCSKAEIPTAPVVKGSMPRKDYEDSFIVPTLIINLGNENTIIDEEIYAIAIGQGIVSTLNPGTVFDTFSSKKGKPVKRDQGKTFSEKKISTEPTSNAKLLFKK